MGPRDGTNSDARRMKPKQIQSFGPNQPLDEEQSFIRGYAGIFYDPREPSNLKIFQDQQVFLRIAAKIVPDFARSLLVPGSTVIADWITRHGSVPAPTSPAYSEYCSQFLKVAREWARRFNIETNWVVTEACDTVLSGIVYGGKGIDPVLAFGTWRRTPKAGGETRAFQLPAWNPRVETDAAYVARADSAWEQLRDAYVVETKNEMIKAGQKRVPAKRKNKVAPEVRFEWAALRQCTSTPIADLADRYGVETEEIRVSTDRILRGLGFQPRT
jgi:hypothetical protein